ncbi:MAG: hypothetical protein IVW57_14885 [Ktedonobacterales bacterium]|nr:hypothetical protein [Ktedonobacterales bacterium]
MRLHMILPNVETEVTQAPRACRWCGSQHIYRWQQVAKRLRDTRVEQVQAQRWFCRTCGRTWRVYPVGVTQAQRSQRLAGTAVMLYLLGLSYGAVALALGAMGHPFSKSSVYYAVQAAAARVLGLRRAQVVGGVRTPALAGDLTSVRVKGKWLPLGVSVDDLSGQVLTIDALTGEDAATLKEWITPVAEQVGARLLITDDADSFKQVAAALGLPQQVGKAHVVRNTNALITALRPAALVDADGSLCALGLTTEQAVADLERLGALVGERDPGQEGELEESYRRYAAARGPGKGETASLAYRLRNLFLDRWNLWPRLVRYRTWRGPGGETIDGTNNGCERGIGWWIKERYRPMRGYKREQSAVNVSRLLAWCGNQLEAGACLLEVLA